MNALFAGIDVSLADNKAPFINGAGEDVATRLRFPNNALGAELFVHKTLELCSQLNPERVLFGLEATSMYGWHLAMLLHQAQQLAPFHPAAYLLNPRIVKGFKKSYPRVPKTDWADAWVIAQRLRFGQPPTPFRFDQRYFPLQRLTRLRVRLAKNITREKNYFLSYLFLKCSGLTSEKPISDFFGASASALVTEWYSVEDIAAASLELLAQFLIDKSGNKFPNPIQVAHQIQVAARHSYRLPPPSRAPSTTSSPPPSDTSASWKASPATFPKPSPTR
ncbi:MAG: transposase [Bacillota bacterium]